MLRALDRFEETIITVLIGFATILIFTAVVHRFLAGLPAFYPYMRHINLGWAQELCIYMFVWMAKFGAAYGVRQGVHVGVDVLLNKLKGAFKHRVILFGILCGVTFTAIVGTMGALFVYDLSHTTSTTPDLEWPAWIVYLAVPLGSYLMCFRFIQVAVTFYHTGEMPHHDVMHVDGLEEELKGVKS